MNTRIAAFAAALALTLIAPSAFAQGIDSARSPYAASAYSGAVPFAGSASALVAHRSAPSAYRYSGQHAGGPANDLRGR